MSLLNEALRKRERDQGIPEKIDLLPEESPPRGKRVRAIHIFLVILVSLTFLTLVGVWLSRDRAGTHLAGAKDDMGTVREHRAETNDSVNMPAQGLSADPRDGEERVPAREGQGREARRQRTEVPGVESKGDPGRLKKGSTNKKEPLQKTVRLGTRKSREGSLPASTEKAYYQKAREYHRANNLEEAAKMYREVLIRDPGHEEAIVHLASVYLKTSLFSEARRLLQKLVNREQQDPRALLYLGIAEIGLGRPEEAASHLEMVTGIEEGLQFQVYFHRGVAYSHLERFEEAALWYRKAEGLDPSHPPLLFNMAVVYDKAEKYTEALRYYESFLNSGDNSPVNEKRAVEHRVRTLRTFLSGQAARPLM